MPTLELLNLLTSELYKCNSNLPPAQLDGVPPKSKSTE